MLKSVPGCDLWFLCSMGQEWDAGPDRGASPSRIWLPLHGIGDGPCGQDPGGILNLLCLHIHMFSKLELSLVPSPLSWQG